MNNKSIRIQMRQRRSSLDDIERLQASASICAGITNSPYFMRARHIALYLSNDGEIDISPVIHAIWQRNKCCYLPVLNKYGKKLSFAPYTAGSVLHNNRFGIPEPMVSKREILTPHQLDLVLTPLVAFDKQGNRIGMGGGYYDRSFAFLRRRQHLKRPHLMGIGYHFQQVEKLPKETWDVPLFGAFTENGYQAF